MSVIFYDPINSYQGNKIRCFDGLPVWVYWEKSDVIEISQKITRMGTPKASCAYLQ
jgi:hypothetical protein